MDLIDDELLNLFNALENNKVRYIMVGGFATGLNGYVRHTADADIWIEDTAENRKQLRKAFIEAQIGDFEAFETIDFIPSWTTVRLNSYMELDLMTHLKQLSKLDFESCYALAPTAQIQGIPVKFLHINHLIAEKEKSGRPKDLIDLEELKKIRSMQG